MANVLCMCVSAPGPCTLLCRAFHTRAPVHRPTPLSVTATSTCSPTPPSSPPPPPLPPRSVAVPQELRRGTLQEIQRLTIDGGISAVGGAFTLKYQTFTTAPISADISSPNKNCTTMAAGIVTALELLQPIGEVRW